MDWSNKALIIVDVQNDFCSPDGFMGSIGKDLSSIDKTMPNIKRLIELFRRTNGHVIFVRTEHHSYTDSTVWNNRSTPTGICRTDWGREFYEISPLRTEYIITKHRYSAFVGTNLEVILRSQKIDTLYLSGYVTNVCIESTAREAFMKDYDVTTVKDCTASYNMKEHESALHNLSNYFGQVKSLDELFNLAEKA